MRRALLAAVLAAAMSAQAAIEAYRFDDPALEARYKSLIDELRCLVCQNQNLADSNAELAQDLRRKTYEMLVAGRSDDEILDFMVQRYGDFVLYRPPLRPATVLLWIGPFVILAVGLGVLARVVSRRRAAEATSADGGADLARAERLLAENKDGKK
jgi:cytochrome c-type biogenesis protein CcmH